MAVRTSTNVPGNTRWKILARCTIHIPPTIISIALLLLNYFTIYFDDPGANHQNLLFNGLQFAAKVHEILIVASLSLVAANYIQYELVHPSGRGLSLGGVLAGFQLNNLNSVINPGLWSKSLTRGFRVRRLLFALTIIFLMGMVAVVGPSSAILILPAIGWWPISFQILDPYVGNVRLQKFFVSTNPEALWPTNITLDNFMPSDCKTMTSSTPKYCPAGGVSNIIAQAIENTDTPINISIPSVSIGPQAVSVYNRVLDGVHPVCPDGANQNYCFLSSTPASSVSNMLQTALAYYEQTKHMGQSTLLKLSLPNGTSFFGVQSFSVCSPSQKILNAGTKSSQKIQFPIVGETNGWSIDGNALFPFRNQSNWQAATWIDSPFLGDNRPSVSAAFITTNGDQSAKVISCSVYASWVPRETYLVPSTGPTIYSPSTLSSETWETSYNHHAHININADWANLALPPNKTITPLVSKLNALPYSKRQQPLSQTELGRGIGSAISLIVTDAISRNGNDVTLTGLPGDSNDDAYALPSHNGKGYPVLLRNSPEFKIFDINNATPLKMTLLRNGYSYSTDGITRLIALTVLLAHIIIALVHTIILVGIGWESHRLRSLKDLFLLAANAPPAKASRLATSLYTVKVRKTSLSQLGIILDGHKKPVNTLMKDEERGLGNKTGKLPSRDDSRESSLESSRKRNKLRKPNRQ